jgi:hypothetical protein
MSLSGSKFSDWLGANRFERHRAVVPSCGASSHTLVVLPRRIRVDGAELATSADQLVQVADNFRLVTFSYLMIASIHICTV